MEAKIINGKILSQKIREDIKRKVDSLRNEKGIIPGLTVILVGQDPASQIYVRNKERACQQVGISSNVIRLSDEVSEEQLLQHINKLNKDESVHGILVQLPLPKHIHEEAIIRAISPEKDVDGFHPINVGNLVTGVECFEPCTPKGIIKLIHETGEEISGKNVVIINRSNIVGKPVSMMLLKENATVTICHSKTQDLKKISSQADILVVAIGKPQTISDDYVKEGAIVIDVGTSRVGERLMGDVIFDEVKKKANWITPVPGGVGPMTITMLLENTLIAAGKNG